MIADYRNGGLAAASVPMGVRGLQRPRYGCVCLFALIATLCAPSAAARASCDTPGPQVIPELSQRVADLEQRLRNVPEAQRNSPDTQSAQREGLVALEQLQCAIESQAPSEGVQRGPAVNTPFVEIPILYITDRGPESSGGKHSYFGPKRAEGGASFGVVKVNMPAERYKAGELLPVNMKITLVKGASGGISVAKPEIRDWNDLGSLIGSYKALLPPRGRTVALVFVHGFNATYTDAMKAAARLSFGLRQNLLTIAISWPSQGEILQYWHHEDTIQASVERLRPYFAQLLSRKDIDETVVVAHSMGTRLVTRVLSELELQGQRTTTLTRIAYAAADLGEEEFRGLWNRLQPMARNGWTIYTSKNDLTMMASRFIHGPPRVGDSKERVFVIDPADSVDASAIASALTGYGHSYIIDNEALQKDLQRWLDKGVPARGRNLRSGNTNGATFWELSP